jgi:hypothetical protein
LPLNGSLPRKYNTVKFKDARHLMIIAFVVCIAACGGSSSGGGDAPPTGGISTTNSSPGGIWRGTDSLSGLTVIGIVDELGDLRFVRSDDTQFLGSVSVAGSAISGNIEGITEVGSYFADGSTHGSGTISGTVSERATLNVTISFRTDNGSMTTSNFPLTYDPTYDADSSLAAIAGKYAEPSTGSQFTVDGSGHVSGREEAYGCTVNGSISIVDSAYNAYRVSYAYSGCSGQAVVLNGVTATGLATLDTTASPVRAVIGVSGSVSGKDASLVDILTRM